MVGEYIAMPIALSNLEIEMQIGDRVRITRNVYTNHPSRRKDGIGTVIKSYKCKTVTLYGVLVDNPPPEDVGEEWIYQANELERIT